MEYSMRSWKLLLPLLASTLCFAAQPDRITGTIDSSQMVALPRSVNPKAQPRYDQGPVESSLQFGYVTLVVALRLASKRCWSNFWPSSRIVLRPTTISG